jgi:ClpP class serine protease
MTNDLTQMFGQKAKKSAKAMAQQVAKTVKEEREGLLKTAKSHVVKESAPQPNLVDEIVKGEQVSPQEEAQIKSKTKSNIQRLEVELAKLRGERERQEEQWRREQEVLMQSAQEEDEGSVALPTSPQRGPKGPAGKREARGTGEMIKSKK